MAFLLFGILRNYYEGKIVTLCIRERLFVERMYQKKIIAETLFKIGFVPYISWLPSSMSNYDWK